MTRIKSKQTLNTQLSAPCNKTKMFFDRSHLKRWPSKTRQKMKKTVKKPLFCQKYAKTAKKAVFDVFLPKSGPEGSSKWEIISEFRFLLKNFKNYEKVAFVSRYFKFLLPYEKHNWISENFRTIITKFPNFSLVSTRSIAIMGHFRTTFSKMRWPKLSDFRK